MRTCPFIRLCPLLVALLATLGALPARAQQKARPAQARLFKSRAALAAALGEPVARQVPAALDFALFALVWVKLPVDPAPGVEIVTLPADRMLRHTHSGALRVDLTRKRTAVEVTLVHDSPCSGGPRRAPEMLARCHKRLQAGISSAKKTQILFATPRARLRRVVAIQRVTPPRP